jgi:site-specific DNA recombinase
MALGVSGLIRAGKKVRKLVAISGPARKQAVIYARVSSKEQEEEGVSVPAQLKLLKGIRGGA